MLINEYRNSKPVQTNQASLVRPDAIRPKKILDTLQESKVLDAVAPIKAHEPQMQKPVGRLFENPKIAVEQTRKYEKNKVTASMPFQKHVSTSSNSKKILNAESYHVGKNSGIGWKEFLSYPRSLPTTTLNISIPASLKLNVCGDEVVKAVTAPGLSEKDFEWCKWTLSDTGGKVKVSSCVK